MSGHSKWATIKRKKGAADAKRGQAFTKYVNAVALAAREGADPNTNFKLRLAIDKARAINMPTNNIDRAIARGSGKDGTASLQEVVYEGYGPGGVAVLVSAATDNKNRTSAEVRSLFSKSGGNLAEPGSVTYQFTQKGVIQVDTSDADAASLAAIDSGAEDVEAAEEAVIVYTQPAGLMKVKQNLETAGLEVVSAEISYIPKQPMPVEDPELAKRILNLVDNLEELDDVVATYSNFDIPEAILEAI